MADTATDVGQVLADIRNTDLLHPDDQLLECFLHDSIIPELALDTPFRRAPPWAQTTLI